jgi:hypothetical protein
MPRAPLIRYAWATAGAGDLSALLSNLWILAFICIQLSVHLAVVLAVGLAVKLPMEVSPLDGTRCIHSGAREGGNLSREPLTENFATQRDAGV